MTELSDFVPRHVGPSETDRRTMLEALGVDSLDALIEAVVPGNIRTTGPLELPDGVDEATALMELEGIAGRNVVARSLIGQGYHDCHVPAVIRRNVFENPSWYTAYTPYQPEIAQGRLEVLFHFQTMIAELTGMAVANASLLDEATAAAEAMAMAHRALRGKRATMLVSDDCHPQTLDVLGTRAEPLGIRIERLAPDALAERCRDGAGDGAGGDMGDVFAVLVQYPGTRGQLPPAKRIADGAKAAGALTLVAADPLALTLLEPPGSWGADVVVGSAQRFGVPMGFGGPHAAYMATTETLRRSLPGRLVGQSITADGKPAWRLALQTREQHIRREKATSNICTAQALLAIMATLYACHHGPDGLARIARRVRGRVDALASTLRANGLDVVGEPAFDALEIALADGDTAEAATARLLDAGFHLRALDERRVGVSFDETTTADEVRTVAAALLGVDADGLELADAPERDAGGDRAPGFLSQPCFHEYRSETTMMRWLKRLADKDIALDRAMIPLGSCTMKLNAAAEMTPVTWPAFADVHPFAPASHTAGYRRMIDDLERWLAACTGYDAVSLQPNAGSQGEYAGLLAIKRYHEARGDADRTVCLIPSSAHGTNPASAQMAGLDVVVVKCDDAGNVDVADLDAKIAKHDGRVAAIMITYPSTHGVFEAGVTDVCERVHAAGGQVYIDGANLNALVGTAAPGKFGGDVSHLNLHKTFCIPHGGGGPGVGPIGVGAHLAPYLPGHRELGDATGVVSAAPFGSAMILPITWMYIRMTGSAGLQLATETAILSANYIAKRLEDAYPILYRGERGRVAHECILDTRKLKADTGITVDDIAKRLMDHGFHAPTMSFPVAGTLMIEPTESESLAEIDRFCEAMLSIREEADRVRDGEWPADDNPLANAPHTVDELTGDEWSHPYSRTVAAYPSGRDSAATKYWPPVSRIDNVYGDRHLICTCPPLESYEADAEAESRAA